MSEPWLGHGPALSERPEQDLGRGVHTAQAELRAQCVVTSAARSKNERPDKNERSDKKERSEQLGRGQDMKSASALTAEITPRPTVYGGVQNPPVGSWVPFEWIEPRLGRQIHGEVTVIRPEGVSVLETLRCGPSLQLRIVDP